MMIDILHPLQDTLEELCLEIDTFGLEELLDKDGNSDFIQSLTHFKNLKLLSTSAEMWRGYESDLDAWHTGDELKDDQRLCRRLPPGIEMLVFPLSEDEPELPLNQLRNIIQTHAVTLPCLKRLRVGVKDQFCLENCKMILEKEKEHLITDTSQLKVDIGGHVKTAFDDIVHSRYLPDLK